MGFRYKMYESYRQYTTKRCELDSYTIDDIIERCGNNRQDIIDEIRQACYEKYDDGCYDTDYDDTDDYDNELSSDFDDELEEFLDSYLEEEVEEDDEGFLGEL